MASYQEKLAEQQRKTAEQFERMSDMFRRPARITEAEKADYAKAQANKEK